MITLYIDPNYNSKLGMHTRECIFPLPFFLLWGKVLRDPTKTFIEIPFSHKCIKEEKTSVDLARSAFDNFF